MTGPSTSSRTTAPQAFVSSYAPRIRTYGNPLLTPVIQPTVQQQPIRTTKRGTNVINYAEDGYDDDDFDDTDGPSRRPTGLRSLRRDESGVDKTQEKKELGKEIDRPVAVQGIWREWMGKQKKVM